MINGFADILHKYDCFIVDIWGVLYDEGDGAFEGVIPLLEEIKRQNKTVIFLSNAPRKLEHLTSLLSNLGIRRDLYSRVHSSGMETITLISENKFAAFGNKCFTIDGNEELVEGIKNLEITDELDEADFVLLTGIKVRDNLLHYQTIAKKIVDSSIPVICPNPDVFVVINGGQKLYCQGGIAKMCEELGCKNVIYIGKPNKEVYDRIMSWYPNIEKSRMVVVGDNPSTDVMGGNKNGIDSVFITNGMYASPLHTNGLPNMKAIELLLKEASVKPTHIAEWFAL